MIVVDLAMKAQIILQISMMKLLILFWLNVETLDLDITLMLVVIPKTLFFVINMKFEAF